MSGVHFARPELLGLLVLVPVIYAGWAFAMVRGTRRARALSRAGAGGPRFVAAALFAIAAALAVVAVARPQWGTRNSAIPREGAQLVVVLDVSRSMASKDVAPSRLDAAKTSLDRTLDRLGGDRFGLVIFAGDARLRFPLTTDFAAASQVIKGLETGTIIVDGGTSTASGLDIALDAFDKDAGGGRLMLLVTDGDDLGADPAGVAQRVRESGIELLVAGAGTTEGGRIPVYDQKARGFVDKLDASGKPIVTKLNEPFLRALAAASGGRYLGSDLGAVPGAVAGRLASLQRARIEARSADVPIEQYQWFAGAALAALVLGSLLEKLPRPGRKHALAGAFALVALMFGSCATDAYTANDAGIQAYRANDYDRAIELFLEARAAKPDDPDVTLNLAAALHGAGRDDEANLAARRALTSRSSDVRARAQASIGHIRFAMKDLPGALEAFRQALIEDPKDERSRHDYEVVLRLLYPPGQDSGDSSGDQQDGGDNGDQQPGGANGQQPGGQSGQQPGGNQPPQPGQAQPGSQSDPNSPGSASGSRPATPQEIDQALKDLDTQITRLVADAGEEPTASQANEILNLLAERARILGIRDALAGGGDPKDY